jgi:hypothetical protein
MSCPIFDDDSRSSCSSLDEDEVNGRVSPNWSKYRGLLESHGFRLDTYQDVKDFYHDYAQKVYLSLVDLRKLLTGYSRACEGEDDDALCKDAGLVRNFGGLMPILFLFILYLAGQFIPRVSNEG